MNEEKERNHESEANNKSDTSSGGTTIDEIYRDAMKVNPEVQKWMLVIMYIVILVMMIPLLFMVYQGYSDGIITNEDPVLVHVMLAILIFTCVFTIVIFPIFLIVYFQGHIEYEIRGEVQLDIKYEPSDAFEVYPVRSYGSIIALICLFVLIVVLSIVWRGIPPAGSAMGMFLGAAVIMITIFSKKHYILTEQGLGYIFVGVRPVSMFIDWDKIEGFSMDNHQLHIHLKSGYFIPSIMFPRKIPVLENPEDVRFILQQYIPELE